MKHREKLTRIQTKGKIMDAYIMLDDGTNLEVYPDHTEVAE